MKKKKFIFTVFLAFMLLGIISCLNHDDQEVSNVAQENSQTMSIGKNELNWRILYSGWRIWFK